MKIIFLLLMVSMIAFACSPKTCCTTKNKYLSNVDTTKPYNVKGKYCIIEKKDSILKGEFGGIEFKAFDRISGKSLNDVVVWLIKNDTTKIYFNQRYNTLPTGRYMIVVSGVSNLPLKITNFDIVKDKIYIINCYLGNSLQW